MKTILVFLLGGTMLLSCHRGVWVSKDAYRPRKPEFSILQEKFQGNTLINTSFVYVSTHHYINFDKAAIYDYTGFYSDGRMIGFDVNTSERNDANKINTWQTADIIGYYTTYGNRVKVQYFVPGNGGQYLTREGFIRKDTIILHDVSDKLFKREITYDTLVISGNPLE
ncbi:MAG: hypothetical protein QM731_08315 [Chitinophagaceae bacterium]